MPFGKSPEQRAQEQAADAEDDARKAQHQAAMASEMEAKRFAASPVGLAVAAKEQGQGFFEVQLEVGHSQRDVMFLSADYQKSEKTKTHAGTLSAIEAAGWRLEHASYIFVTTGESSRDKLLRTGQATAVSGKSVGIYLFRNTD